jgi:diguanylate cyclase (GGDEF)-like protein
MSDSQIMFSFIRNLVYIGFFVMLTYRIFPMIVKLNKKIHEYVIGLLFGCAGILSMWIPLMFSSGTVFDLRNILAAMAGLFGGYRSGIIIIGMIAGYRAFLGAPGLLYDEIILFASTMLGILYYRLEQKKVIRSTPLTNVLLGLLIAALSLIKYAMQTTEARDMLYHDQAWQILIISPLALMAFQYIFKGELQRQCAVILDPITELPNAKMFATQVQTYMDLHEKIAIILLRIDNFKAITDLHNYSYGDELLKSVGCRLADMLPNGCIARSSNDEFLLCLTDFEDSEKLMEAVEPIKSSFIKPFAIQGSEVYINIRIGVAVSKDNKVMVETLIQQADTALRYAKESGEHLPVQFEAKLKDELHQRSSILTALRYAVEREELSIQYQPQFEITTGRVRGFEALIRWNHPEMGMVSPAKFIPLAEESGMIIPIGNWVLKKACETHKHLLLPHFPDSVMSINISVIQLNEEWFPDLVRRVLAQTGLSSSRVELEITESMLMSSIDLAYHRLMQLKEIGVRIALDDFGTGYSSLNYLRHLPFHVIKIDRSFIQDICNRQEGKITELIIRLIQHLNIPVIAEGLESYDQLHLLKEWKCDIAQGYLLSKPLNLKEMNHFISKNQQPTTASS